MRSTGRHKRFGLAFSLALLALCLAHLPAFGQGGGVNEIPLRRSVVKKGVANLFVPNGVPSPPPPPGG